MTLLPLVMAMFCAVSGGPYGLEKLLQAAGPGMGLLLILITPLIWSVPAALMAAELSSALPEEGGYYAWVRTALGPFWAFQAGWWSWADSFVDVAIYPVLFVGYLSPLLRHSSVLRPLAEGAWAQWGLTLIVIWAFALLNIRGARAVGQTSILLGGATLAPFALITVIGLAMWVQHPAPIWQPFLPPGHSPSSTFSMGLYIVLWNYLGWEGLSTINGEVEQPSQTFPRALRWTVPLVTLAYFLPVAAGLVGMPDWRKWGESAWPQVAAAVGGGWLGMWVAITGLVSSSGLYSANLLANSRLPFVIAEDGCLPRVVTRLHPKFGTPWVAIVLSAAIYSVFTLNALSSLVVVDVILYSAVLLLELAALVILRVKRPDMPRPFRIPGGWPGISLVTALPSAILGLAIVSRIHEEGSRALLLSFVALATGPLLYPVLRRVLKAKIVPVVSRAI